LFESATGSWPSFQPTVGEFGRASYRDGQLVDWEPLGASHHVQNVVRTDMFLPSYS
jgi:hypothetical protein